MNGISKAMWLPAAALAACACIALLPASGRAAGSPGEAANPAKVLLEKASKALGENKPWTTRVEKGLFIEWDTEGWGTLRADYTRSMKKPDKLKIDQDNSAYDHPFFRAYYCSGGEAWGMVNLTTRQSPQLTANLKTLIDRADGIRYFLAACDTFFTAAPVPDDSILPGRDLARAGCVLKGDTILFDVNRKTNLLARRIENKGTRSFVFEDYRNVRGHTMPFHVLVYDSGRKASEYQWKTIAFDEKLDDAIFEEYRPPKQ
jgi:hypothetical protein